ncbi:hypothetical protein BH10BAC6_BH10BAC6_09820 [soil metagenome]
MKGRFFLWNFLISLIAPIIMFFTLSAGEESALTIGSVVLTGMVIQFLVVLVFACCNCSMKMYSGPEVWLTVVYLLLGAPLLCSGVLSVSHPFRL